MDIDKDVVLHRYLLVVTPKNQVLSNVKRFYWEILRTLLRHLTALHLLSY